MGWLIFSGTVAGLLSLAEYLRRGFGIPRGAARWIALRISIDVAAGLLAFLGLKRVVKSYPDMVIALSAAVGGVAALRSYVIAGLDAKKKELGLVRIYESFQRLADDRIASIVASQRVSWIHNEAAKALEPVPTNEIINRMTHYFQLRGDYTKSQLAVITANLRKASSNGSGDHSQRVELYTTIVSLGAIGELQKLVEEQQSKARG